MGTGSVEALKSGYRARVYAGKDPITGRQSYVRGEVRRSRGEAEQDATRLVAQVEAEAMPNRTATLATLMEAWSQVVDHELNTRATNEVFLRRVILPTLGDMPLRKLQHRVDILDRLYTHVRRCSSVCDGKPFTEHRSTAAHDCGIKECKPHQCRPMAPSSVRRLHSILSGTLGYAVSRVK